MNKFVSIDTQVIITVFVSCHKKIIILEQIMKFDLRLMIY